MNKYPISNKYLEFLEEFNKKHPVTFDLSKEEISESIFTEIFKIKQGLWRYGILFERRIRFSIADLFQDLIAYYLKQTLGADYEIILEEKCGSLRPDILIKRKEINIAIIEIKTTIGWERNSIEKRFSERIEKLSNTFDVLPSNVIYIFQSPWNVSKEFTNRYWDTDKWKTKGLPEEFPFNQIRPLFVSEDPYYWKVEDLPNFNKNIKYSEVSDSEIRDFANEKVVIPLELTIQQILRI